MDEFERRIRAARPLSGHRNLPLTDRAKRELADLVLAETPEVDERRHRAYWRRPMAWAAVAAAAAIVTLLSFTVFTTPRTYAATPPLLPVTPIAGTAAELLNRLADAAAAADDPAPTGDMHIALQGWFLNTEDDGKALTSIVAPEEYSIDRRADGSYSSVTTAGPPLELAGSAAPTVDAPPEGTVLSRMDYGPGEYEPLFPSPLPTDSEQVKPYFERLLGAGAADASTLFQNIPLVMMDWVLGAKERAAVLRYLASMPDIRTVGDVSDRLGRPGIMFAAARPGTADYTDFLVITPENGTIIAAETHYTGHDRPDLRSPSVTTYYAWR